MSVSRYGSGRILCHYRCVVLIFPVVGVVRPNSIWRTVDHNSCTYPVVAKFCQILFGARSTTISVYSLDAKAVALKKTGTLNTARKKLRTIHASKQFSKTFSSIDMQCVVEKSESRKCRCHLSVCLLSLRLLGHDSLVMA